MNKRAIDRWRRLKSSGAGDGLVEVPSIDSNISTGFGTARYAIGEQGQPRLLIPIGGFVSKKLKSTAKLSLSTSSFKVAGKGTLFIDLMCQDRTLDLVFAELAEEILRRLQEGHPPVSAVVDSIEEFRQLLREGVPTLIPDQKIMGLVGELEVMRLLASYNCRAVDTWVGPFQLRHDFRQGIYALEVKVSGRSDAKRVCIHGIDQLCAPDGGELHLIHLLLERSENAPLSIANIFERLLQVGVDKEALIKGLIANDCLDPYSPEWNRLSFTRENLKVYAVIQGFPRIVESSFSSKNSLVGLSALEYQVDLDHAKSFEVSNESFDALLRRIAG
ncbi:PD-(D/E)XK motif protein [Pseudomonas sp. CDFA 553]|uniref:PD-(D/E)XK motif protein n=1 Tax=Pseudomonas quasicaspiana TaxID=2829821 RepID=UPI001E61842C|nr:PD-(D/E)XK motif protein [Pseudomonas quasicaspiana]MCD5991364.1 PD-(D/E)XK motif protein [Pseudomonas quasicaspiana]